MTSYSLVYGVEEVFPLECQIPSLCLSIQEELTDKENTRLHLEKYESLDENKHEVQQN